MNCACGSARLCDFGAKSSDLNHLRVGAQAIDGYVPYDMGIGGGDVEFAYCLDCGRIQGKFPLPKTELETIAQNPKVRVQDGLGEEEDEIATVLEGSVADGEIVLLFDDGDETSFTQYGDLWYLADGGKNKNPFKIEEVEHGEEA